MPQSSSMPSRDALSTRALSWDEPFAQLETLHDPDHYQADLSTFPGHSISRASPWKPSWLARLYRNTSKEDLEGSDDIACVPDAMDMRDYEWGAHRIFVDGVRFSRDKQHLLLHFKDELVHAKCTLRSFTRVLTIERRFANAPSGRVSDSTAVTIEAVWPRLPLSNHASCRAEGAYIMPLASKESEARRQSDLAVVTSNCPLTEATIRGEIITPSTALFCSEAPAKHLRGRGVASHAGFYILAHLPAVEGDTSAGDGVEPPTLAIKLDVRSTQTGLMGGARKSENVATHAVTHGIYGCMDVHGVLRELLERPDLIPCFDP